MGAYAIHPYNPPASLHSTDSSLRFGMTGGFGHSAFYFLWAVPSCVFRNDRGVLPFYILIFLWAVRTLAAVPSCNTYNAILNNNVVDRLPVELTSTDEPKNQGERRLKIVSVRSEASFDDFSLSPACFSSLAGAVLTFFAYFFASRQKK